MTRRDDLPVIAEWMRARGDHPYPVDLLPRARARILAEDAARRASRVRLRAGMGLAAAVALVAVLATAVLPTRESPAPPASTPAAGPLVAVVDLGASLFLVSTGPDGDSIAGRQRIEIGHRYVAAQSPDGRTLAVVGYPGDDSSQGDLLLVDPATWTVRRAPVFVSADLSAPVWTADSHTLAWFQPLRSAGQYSIRRDFQLMRWTVGTNAPVPGGILEGDFMPIESVTTGPDTLVVYGQRVDEEFLAAAAPQVVSVDLATGSVGEPLTLEGVVAGQRRHAGADGTGVYTQDTPAVVWDLPRGRLLVADHDHLSTVDLDAWTVERRAIAPRTSWLDAVLALLVPAASAKAPLDGELLRGVLSPDGGRLYLTGEVIDRGEGRPVKRPLGIRVVDVADAAVVATLDAPVDQVALSPDGRTVVATGATVTFPADGEGISDSVPSDLLVLDAADLAEVARVAPSDDVTEQHLGGFQADGGGAYVLTYRPDVTGWLPSIELLDPTSASLAPARFPTSTVDLLQLHG